MTAYVKLGICKVQFDPLDCDGAIDPAAAALVYCGLTSLEVNPVLTDGLEISDPSGMPNRNCVKIKIDPEIDYLEVVLGTCSLYDPAIDAMFGYSEAIVLADGSVIGSMAGKKGEGSSCICDCGEEACVKRVGVTVWSLALCADGSTHPDGKYVATVLPALQFRPNTDTLTLNAETNGRQYLSIAYENPAFGQGPGNIIPADLAPFDRCRYEFLTDECPPGGCDCGECGSDVAITPLARAGRRVARSAPAATAAPATAEMASV